VQEDNYVYLVVVDDHGKKVDRGTILVINPSGTMTRCTRVNPSLGFKLNNLDQIVER